MRSFKQLFLSLFSKIGIAVVIFSVCRALFYLFNFSSFDSLSVWNILGGIRFDLMTITILYSPLIITHLIFFKGKAKVLKVLFHFSNSIAIILNCIDFEYFKYTLKRTTSDLFITDGIGGDVLNLLPQFISDFWYIGLIIIALIYLSNFLYKKAQTIEVENPSPKYLISYILIITSLAAIGSRGGIQLRPLGVLSASQYATATNIPIVLNTPFTIIKSSYKEDLKELKFFEKERLSQIFNPTIHIKKDSIQKKLNVVLIIAESFSKEYIGTYNQKSNHTPFLDSLIKQSLSFENMFANGKKSIESLPAILSGIPTLMNSSYISSKYSSNQIESIASKLNQHGYKSSFYHGGANGTMGFNSFAQIAGFDRYIGLDEYPNKKDYDGNWGIFDEPFLQFCIKDMNKIKNPFFSCIFTLSSHHPYTIPAQYKDSFIEGELPILQSISYSDFALKQFFKTAEKQDWFDETIFVITADHTSTSLLKRFSSRVGIYEVPLLFYSPKYIKPKKEKRVTQHTDIYPSLIDFLGYEAEIISFGQSIFSKDTNSFAVSYLADQFQLIENNYCLQFNGTESTGLFEYRKDPTLGQNILTKEADIALSLELKMKAILQQYNARLIKNKLTSEND